MRKGLTQPKPVIMPRGWYQCETIEVLDGVLDKLLEPKALEKVRLEINREWGLEVEVALCGNNHSEALAKARTVVDHSYQLAAPIYIDGARTAISEIRTKVRKERIAELEERLAKAQSFVERKLLIDAIALAKVVFATAKQLSKDADRCSVRQPIRLDEQGLAARKARQNGNRERRREENRQRAKAGGNGHR